MNKVDLLADKTFITEYEGYNVAGKIASKIERVLEQVCKDTYNNQYVVTVTVRRLADDVSSNPDEMEEDNAEFE